MKESWRRGSELRSEDSESFVVKELGGYKGGNPKTGRCGCSSERNSHSLRSGKELKEMVNMGGLNAFRLNEKGKFVK